MMKLTDEGKVQIYELKKVDLAIRNLQIRMEYGRRILNT